MIACIKGRALNPSRSFPLTNLCSVHVQFFQGFKVSIYDLDYFRLDKKKDSLTHIVYFVVVTLCLHGDKVNVQEERMKAFFLCKLNMKS